MIEISKSYKKYFDLIRFDKPVGTLLLLMPCLMGLFLAKKNNPDLASIILIKFIIFFGFGAFFMRSAGCIINDIFDRNFDRRVARTRNRPLASKSVTIYQAIILLIILLILSLLILLQFNIYAIISGFLALIFAIFYPLMKRVTFYPQIFLGMAFNYGIIMADLALNEKIFVTSFILFSAAIIWTVIYDSFYAFQDIEDDLKIGVKSSAIKFSKNPRISFFALTIIMFLLIFTVGFLQNFSWVFYILSFAAFCYEIFLIFAVSYKDPTECLRAFKNNVNIGLLILLAIIFG